MSGPKNTFMQPAAVRNAANNLSAAGEGLWTVWLDLLGKITAANSAAPWGTDEPGREFNKNYLGGSHEGGPPAAATLSAAEKLMPVYKGLGADVRACVDGTMGNDDVIAKWFKTE